MSGFNLSAWALKHRSVIIYAMLVAVVAGVMAFRGLGRAEDPTFIIKTMVVQANWPGATLDETTRQVTERLERKLQEVPKLDRLESYTRPGVTTIFVHLKGSATAAEVPDLWYQVRKGVADIRHTLPQGIVGPFFNDEFGDTFGIIYGFTADGFTHRELLDRVEAVRSELLHVPDVSKIELLGAQDERIFIEFSMAELASLGIDRSAVLQALASQNVVRPSGEIQTGAENISVRVSGAFTSETDIANVNFVVNGRLIRLADIATIRRGYADPPQPMFRVNGREAIGLAIAMREGGDILAMGRNVDAAMNRLVAELPVGIDVQLVADQAVTVNDAIAEFMESLWQAVAIILVVSFVALGVRAGAIVALAIPLTLAVVFAIMQIAQIDMQRISLGALIIALALMVDDAMTTTDATLTRLAAGDTPIRAASYAFSAYAAAMLAGTLVTVAGFVPVGFAASSAGEYTFTLFAVVTIALLVSWVVAVLFAPLLQVLILRPPAKEATRAAAAGPGRVMGLYRGFLEGCLRLRWITIAVTLGLFVLSVLALPLVPRQFFPSSDRPELLVDLASPQNASIYASESVAEAFDKVLAGDPDVARWSTYVGRGAIRFYLPLNVQLPNDFFAQAVIVARDVAARERLHARLDKVLAEQFPQLVARVAPLELGPPVGWPVQYRVSGPDVEKVRAIAFDLAAAVASSPDAERINYNWIEPSRQVRIRLNQDEARLLGLSTAQLTGVLNTVFSGQPVTQVRDDIYLVNVLARATDEERVSLGALASLQVPLPNGRTVPLRQIAVFEYAQDYPAIWRRDRVPTLTVQADVRRGVLPESVVEGLAPKIAALRATLPPGYAIVVGGTVEESAASLGSVIAVVPVMLLLMFTVLMFELKSFQRLVIVLSVAPLGLIGVVAALLASGRPLGFVAILGVLALIGMITKNAVILIGQIEADRAAGRTVRDAVIAASCARFRPIMLTAVSTVLGMIPIAPTVFWGPMAFAIMGGLLVGTLLTLIFLPALYVAWFGADTGPEAAAAPEAAQAGAGLGAG
ncbi:efflux RND transporter permease subunit [Ancylobacter lacus]|uniref:efflux RND transporter permease subunit n=1 Tax=Ancylobacter lacus TaxID=2579970 RepID=UPI001BCCC6FA|nr:efflux RND transporter permease subunit [Ancylobacter lacus]